MSEDRFETVRRKLTAMRDALTRESQTELAHILNQRDKHNGVSDDADLADIACRHSMQTAQLARHQSQLRAIKKALSSIDDGTYGICEDCEEEIPIGRLHAMPFALRCVECQGRHEMMSPAEKEEAAELPIVPEEDNDD